MPSYGKLVIAAIFSCVYFVSFPFITYSYWKKLKISGLFFLEEKLIFVMINIKKEFSYNFSIEIQNDKRLEILIRDGEQSVLVDPEWAGCYTLDEAKAYVSRVKRIKNSIKGIKNGKH